MSTFGDRVKAFNRELGSRFNAVLPKGVDVMNPFLESPLALKISDAFYDKYYNDYEKRYMILGINPGRFGAALTGVPFTDFKRLEEFCGISAEGMRAHEPSSEFVYAMITGMGTVQDFYRRFYINSLCPLGFAITKANGRIVNYNYYDDPALYKAVKPFMLESVQRQIDLGGYTDECFCLGIKNAEYLRRLNDEQGYFRRITVLPHPRFIVQYQRKRMGESIAQYHSAFGNAGVS
jgi:hypothetical protein